MQGKIAILGFVLLSILLIGCIGNIIGNINTQNVGMPRISHIERTEIAEIEIAELNMLEVEARRVRRQPRPIPRDGYGVCTRVIDGDTIEVTGFGRIRLAGVNSPERGRPGFREVTAFTRGKTLNRRVFVDVDEARPRDRHGRVRAVVNIDGINLNEELVNRGHAKRI